MTTLDVELVDLSDAHNVTTGCPKPASLPTYMGGAIGGLVNGEVIVCGGGGSSLVTEKCFKFNSNASNGGEWVETVSLDRPRYEAASLVFGDKMYILGGKSSNTFDPEIILNTTLVYQDGIMSQGPAMPYSVHGHCVVKMNETHFFVAGGKGGKGYAYISKKAHLVDITTWTWTELQDMAYVRYVSSCGKFFEYHGCWW